MKYPLIASKILTEQWALRGDKLAAIWRAVTEDTSLPPMRPPMRKEDDEEKAFATDGQPDPVMVIPVFGVMGKHLSSMEMECGACSMDRVSALLKVAAADPYCERVVMAFHTPGGTVQGTPELGRQIAALAQRKPVVGFTDGDCCSAGIWLASQCSAFYVTESARVGSVGVRCLLLDESEKLAKEGIKVESFTSGKFKDMGGSFRPPTDEERTMLKTRVETMGAVFRAVLTARRTIAPEDMEGQVWTGIEAVAKGFADGTVDDLDECLALAARLT